MCKNQFNPYKNVFNKYRRAALEDKKTWINFFYQWFLYPEVLLKNFAKKDINVLT